MLQAPYVHFGSFVQLAMNQKSKPVKCVKKITFWEAKHAKIGFTLDLEREILGL